MVTNQRVPRIIRHSLNLESGLNDGLALPAVLALTAAADVARRLRLVAVRDAGRRRRRDHGAAGRVRGRAADAARRERRTRRALYALGVAFAAYGAAVLPPEGNGFISVFVAAIAFGIWRPDVRECFETRSEDLLEVVKLGVFLVFGAHLHASTCCSRTAGRRSAIAAFTLLVARPVAVFVALAGARQVDTAGKAFMAWFGPKGVATMTFALFVLGSAAPDAASGSSASRR